MQYLPEFEIQYGSSAAYWITRFREWRHQCARLTRTCRGSACTFNEIEIA